MKLRILFACLVIMMSVSTVALGTIVWTSNWSGYGDVTGNFVGSEATAIAYGEQEDEFSSAHGWWQLKTTESGYFHWWYYIEANAYAFIFYEDENYAWAWAEGKAMVNLEDFCDEPLGMPINAYIEVSDGNCGDPPDFKMYTNYPTPIDAENTHYFEVNDRIYCDHDVDAFAEISEGSDSTIKSWSEGIAAIGLEEAE